MSNLRFETKQDRKRLLVLLNERKRRQADKSLYFFTKYILHYNLLHPVPHGEMCEWMEETTWDESILLVPRGTYKSTIGTVAFTLWLLTKDPNLRVLITSAEQTNTKGWLSEIKIHCEQNETFRELYGDWVPKRALDREKGWTATALKMRPVTRKTATPSVVAASSGMSKVSQHCDLAICDDLMNDKTSATREQIDSQQDYLELLVPILDPPLNVKGNRKKDKHGPRKVIGTRWGHDDLYIRLMTRDDFNAQKDVDRRHWKRFVRKAYHKNHVGEVTRVFFPMVFTPEYLDNLKRNSGMSNYNFSCQYLNDPQPDEERTFKLKNFGFWNKGGRTLSPGERLVHPLERILPIPHLKRFATTCDPAGSDEQNADYTAIVTVALSVDRFRFIYDVTAGQWRAPSKIIEEMVRVYEAFHPVWIGVEEITFGLAIRAGVNEIFRKTGIAMPVRALKPGSRSKERRIMALEPFISDGGMFIRVPDELNLSDTVVNRSDGTWDYDREMILNLLEPGMAELMDELLKFPTAPRRDAADALAYHVPDFDLNPSVSLGRKVEEGSFEWWMKQVRGRSQLLPMIRA